MTAGDVTDVLDSLAVAGIEVSIGGGWGIDALLGRETRVHGDLDLAIDAEFLDAAIVTLTRRGLAVTLDQRPARVVLGDGQHAVDLHPVRFGPDGTGLQPGLEGETFVYPPGSTESTGRIGGRMVRCVSPELQAAFHAHYEPRTMDRADMDALVAAFGVELPPAYRRR